MPSIDSDMIYCEFRTLLEWLFNWDIRICLLEARFQTLMHILEEEDGIFLIYQSLSRLDAGIPSFIIPRKIKEHGSH